MCDLKANIDKRISCTLDTPILRQLDFSDETHRTFCSLAAVGRRLLTAANRHLRTQTLSRTHTQEAHNRTQEQQEQQQQQLHSTPNPTPAWPLPHRPNSSSKSSFQQQLKPVFLPPHTRRTSTSQCKAIGIEQDRERQPKRREDTQTNGPFFCSAVLLLRPERKAENLGSATCSQLYPFRQQASQRTAFKIQSDVLAADEAAKSARVNANALIGRPAQHHRHNAISEQQSNFNPFAFKPNPIS